MICLTKLRLFLLIGFALMANVALAAPSFPELTGRVVDQMAALSATQKQSIIDKLAAFEAKSTAQIVVAVVPSLEDYDIRDYGYQLARHWELGQKDVNNGMLLLVAPNERKVSIEVGYGLEGSLTDALSFAIIQDHILPKFRAGKMGAGIELGVDMILQGLAGEISAQSLKSDKGFNGEIDIATVIFMIFFFGIFIFIIVKMIRGGGNVGTGGTSSSSSRSSSSSWGSSSGGGFSGGGGSFGGGGASGGW